MPDRNGREFSEARHAESRHASSGAAGSYTSAIKAQYPDGSEWHIISMFELVDGRQKRATVFFAPLFDAPEWRRPFVEPMSDG
jgi:hypothetical protein